MLKIQKLTQEYIAAFNERDLNQVANCLAEDFKLTDPEVTALTPKSDVLEYLKELFDQNADLRFEAHTVFVDGNSSVIHFTLSLGAKVFDGVDIITWENQKMTSLTAYLTKRP